MTAPSPNPPATGATRVATPSPDLSQASPGELIGQLTEQLSRLVRDEARLAQAETTQKARRFGIGAGLFGGAGLTAFFGLAVLIGAAVLGLAELVPGWLAALIVAVVLFALAAGLALLAKKDVRRASPPLPTQAMAGVRADVTTVKQALSR
jgi:hypothetical protein